VQYDRRLHLVLQSDLLLHHRQQQLLLTEDRNEVPAVGSGTRFEEAPPVPREAPEGHGPTR
jgi:hypothetical protein